MNRHGISVRWSVMLATMLLAVAAAALSPAAAAQRGTWEVPGGPWRTVDAAGWHTCAIRTDGTLWCWGSNAYGKLGDGTTTDRWPPVQVGTGTWASVSTGDSHTCAIRTEGTLWCWGNNASGELGDGTTTDRWPPVQVGTGTWASVSTGSYHTCAVDTAEGGLWCWGDNDWSQLGDGSREDQHTPLRIGTSTGWTQVSAGYLHSCGVRRDGTAWCWGENRSGQHGNGSIHSPYPPGPYTSRPARVAASVAWQAVSAGGDHTCGVDTAGGLWCWGGNGWSDLGDGTGDRRTLPVAVGSGRAWRTVSAGSYYLACAVDTGEGLWCWGRNDVGQVGVPSPNPVTTPVRTGTDLTWQTASAGRRHACAIGHGTLRCWGNDRYDLPGSTTTTAR